MRTYCTTAVFLLLAPFLVAASVPRTDVTVSGFSSGGAMATQLHLAFSKTVSGCGILAGLPYYCAGHGTTMATCMNGPATFISTSALQWKLNWYVSSGNIDALSNVIDDPVYVFSGKYDTVVDPGIVKLNEQLYTRLGADVKANFEMATQHGFLTDNFGGSCTVLDKPNYINNCNFTMAYEMLNHLYGGRLQKPPRSPPTPLKGRMFLFDQKAFMDPPSDSILLPWIQKNMVLYNPTDRAWTGSTFVNITATNATSMFDTHAVATRSSLSGFDAQGFVYFPSACTSQKKCSIHVALHGCLMGKSLVGDVFATKAGYLEVAELNNIIVVFPQILRSTVFPTNPMGCWDWWGYSSIYYATQNGPQVSGIKKMTDTVRLINTAFLRVHE